MVEKQRIIFINLNEMRFLFSLHQWNYMGIDLIWMLISSMWHLLFSIPSKRWERERLRFTHANFMCFCNGLLTSCRHCLMLFYSDSEFIWNGNHRNYESFVAITKITRWQIGWSLKQYKQSHRVYILISINWQSTYSS